MQLFHVFGTNLPSRRGENMLVPLIVASFNDFPCMRFIFLLGSVCEQSDVVMDVKIEQRPRFSSRLVDNEVIECIMLPRPLNKKKKTTLNASPTCGIMISSFMALSRATIFDGRQGPYLDIH